MDKKEEKEEASISSPKTGVPNQSDNEAIQLQSETLTDKTLPAPEEEAEEEGTTSNVKIVVTNEHNSTTALEPNHGRLRTPTTIHSHLVDCTRPARHCAASRTEACCVHGFGTPVSISFSRSFLSYESCGAPEESVDALMVPISEQELRLSECAVRNWSYSHLQVDTQSSDPSGKVAIPVKGTIQQPNNKHPPKKKEGRRRSKHSSTAAEKEKEASKETEGGRRLVLHHAKPKYEVPNWVVVKEEFVDFKGTLIYTIYWAPRDVCFVL